MLETLFCEQRKGLDVQTLQQEPRLNAFKMSLLGYERCLSALKYWCKDSWNAPASFWCWSRMRHDHKMNANGITFWAPRWQRSPLDIYLFSAFNSRGKKTSGRTRRSSSNSQMRHVLCFFWGRAWSLPKQATTAVRRNGMNVTWWARWEGNHVSVWRPEALGNTRC